MLYRDGGVAKERGCLIFYHLEYKTDVAILSVYAKLKLIER